MPSDTVTWTSGGEVENGTHSAIVSGPFDLYVDGPEPNTSTQYLTSLITITPQG